MTNYDLEEVKLLKLQFGFSLLFIFTIIVSLTLTYNEILKFEKKPPLYNNKTEDTILKLNRILTVLVTLGFLLINITNKNIKEKYNLNIKTANLQIDAGILNIIASFIVLYIAFIGDSATEFENPQI